MQLRFALVEDKRSEPKPGLKGLCPVCGELVIAKCGEQRVHHWAHKSKKACDSWWERETEWHKAWKNNFPAEWQEISLPDEQTGEKHIADVRTAHGLVLEFQHSAVEPQERILREKFYKNMIWVVDGTRLKSDYPRFLKGREHFKSTNKAGVYLTHFLDECFPKAWINSSVPVIFDFCGDISLDKRQEHLWCLLPWRVKGYAVIVAISHEFLITTAINYPTLFQEPTQDSGNTSLPAIRSKTVTLPIQQRLAQRGPREWCLSETSGERPSKRSQKSSTGRKPRRSYRKSK